VLCRPAHPMLMWHDIMWGSQSGSRCDSPCSEAHSREGLSVHAIARTLISMVEVRPDYVVATGAAVTTGVVTRPRSPGVDPPMPDSYRSVRTVADG